MTNDYHNTITVGTTTDTTNDDDDSTKGLDFLPYHLHKEWIGYIPIAQGEYIHHGTSNYESRS